LYDRTWGYGASSRGNSSLRRRITNLEFNRPYETRKLRELATEIYEKKVQLAESELQF